MDVISDNDTHFDIFAVLPNSVTYEWHSVWMIMLTHNHCAYARAVWNRKMLEVLTRISFTACSSYFRCTKRALPLYNTSIKWKITSTMCPHMRHIKQGSLNGMNVAVDFQASRVSERLNLTAFFGTAHIGVHNVHSSRVIIAYTLESLSSFT